MDKTIWAIPFTVAELNSRSQNSLSSHLGIVFTRLGDDYLEATMPIDERTMQPMGIMHGGASCALAETAGSAAANFCIDPKEKLCVGLDININHIRAVRSGSVRAIAKALHLGNSTQVWEIKIYNLEDSLVSVARLTMAVIEKNRSEKMGRLNF